MSANDDARHGAERERAAPVEQDLDVAVDLARDEEHDRGLGRADVGGDDDPGRGAIHLDLTSQDRAGVAAAELDVIGHGGAERAALDRDAVRPRPLRRRPARPSGP